MLYDEAYFDAGLYRVGTRSEKWDLMREREGRDDMLPLWVADMDFPSPPEVQEALLKRAAHPTYGYTEPLADDYTAVRGFWQRRHGLDVAPEEMMLLPCVITGMKLAIRAVTQPGDGVIIMSPVYGPFSMSVRATGRTLVDIPLTEKNQVWRMDAAGIEAALKDGAKAVLLCSPHNPIGRLWTEEELRTLCALCDRYGAYLISDEIHADFALDGGFVPVLSLRTAKTVSLCAASKTFNLAGLQQAMAFCRDEAVLKAMQDEAEAAGVRSGNVFALEGTRAAYEHGDAWLDGLTAYLRGNRAEMERLVKELLPKAAMPRLEATYLVWLDLRAYGLHNDELMARTREAGVYFTEGTFFGANGDGCLRVNIGCPRRYLREGMLRLQKALE